MRSVDELVNESLEAGTLSVQRAALGLTSREASRRLAEQGPNEIAHEREPSPWRLLAGQFDSPVIWLLFGACVVSGVLDEVADAVAIGTIVVLNALVGFSQEYRAERAVFALRSMTAPRARVLRDGHPALVPAVEVVVGDVLLLEPGDIVAADGRVLEAHSLSANEAALTGESEPSEKSTAASAPDAPLAERHDALFMGTHIANGTGSAEVVASGMATELGKIAHLLATAQQSQTPLQLRLARVSTLMLYICSGIVAVVALLGLLRGMSLFEVFFSGVSLAVAAVPEGLPAVVTIALALGVRRMVSRHVLVRKLPAVETLGCATVICTDKTGTLTTGVMTVRELWGADPQQLIEAAAADCDAELAPDERSGIGDTTEVAILMAAAERGVRRAQLEQQRPRVVVNPFDSQRMRMSILRADGVLYVKGAVEAVLSLASSGTEGAVEANAKLTARGLRVLAVAIGTGPREEKLQLLGLIGIADPPRPEAIAAVAAARRAGIKTVMITGDHPTTAQVIARELGIVQGAESAEEVVHARATPEDKLNIVRGWKARGAVVAMTGDGVNDAPALREAHIGICMGKTGTEVTREAADMVLTDDNFASIVAAVREGRGIFDNIRKALVWQRRRTGRDAHRIDLGAAVSAAAAAAALDQPGDRRATCARARDGSHGRRRDAPSATPQRRAHARSTRVDIDLVHGCAADHRHAQRFYLGAAQPKPGGRPQPGFLRDRVRRAVSLVRFAQRDQVVLGGRRAQQSDTARGRRRVGCSATRPPPASRQPGAVSNRRAVRG
jgi:Ca2+-transporting ATPase